MPLTFASAYLAGAVLSCVLPIALVIGMVSWYVRSAGRVPTPRGSRSAEAPAPAPAQAPAPVPPHEPPAAPGGPVAG